MTRRNLLVASAAAAQLRAAAPKNIAISSENGLRACARAMEMLQKGEDTLDAAIAGVNINEEDPEDNSVGYGGVPEEKVGVEKGARAMHPSPPRAGAVADMPGSRATHQHHQLVMT